MDLYSQNQSACCGARQQIVRSRENGFVSKECVVCESLPKHERYVSLAELPMLQCLGCKVTLLKCQRSTPPKNYYYACPKCKVSWLVAELVPHWSECFEFNGLAAQLEF